MLPQSIQNQFWHLFNSGKVSQTDIDDSIYKSLCDFTEETAHEIVQGFSRADLMKVRNKTGFFIGILKTYRSQSKGLRKHQAENLSAESSYQTMPSYQIEPSASLYQAAPNDQSQDYGGVGAVGAAVGGAYFDPYGSGVPFPPPPPPPPTVQDPYVQMPYDPYGLQPQVAPGPGMMPQHIDPQQQQQQQQQQMYYDPQFGQAYAIASANSTTMPTASPNVTALPTSVQHLFEQIFSLGLVMQSDIPDSIYDSLKDFDENTQYSIVERFYKSDLSRVRNKTGYFIGILKQARQGKLSGYGFGAGPKGSETTGTPTGSYASFESSPGFGRLSPYCQQRVRELTENGQLSEGDLDHSVFDSLADFSEEDQLTMVDSFCSKDLMAIRNKTAFFIGILKRHRSLKQNADILNQWA